MSLSRRIVSAIVPAALRSRIRRWTLRNRLRRNYRYDHDRFEKYGCPFREFDEGVEVLAYIQMLCHSLEKGMSLREARRGFGFDKARDLIESIASHIRYYGWNNGLSAPLVCLHRFMEFHRARGDASPGLEAEFVRLQSILPPQATKSTASAGVVHLTREDIWRNACQDLTGFFASRHSVREFSDEPIDLELIYRAVRMAQKTPSVCNRQSARVYVFGNDESGQKVLACQSGNRGFGHLADKILIITADLRSFLSIGERNQCWIDGGMFAMSLIYALHSLGLGSCCLNWSVERDADERLRAIANIPFSENVIMLLAVGQLPEKLTVACSERKNLDDVLRVYVSPAPSNSELHQCDTLAPVPSA